MALDFSILQQPQTPNTLRDVAETMKMANIVREGQQQQDAAKALSEFRNKPDKTVDDYASLMSILPPQQAKSVGEAWNLMSNDQIQSTVTDTVKTISALQSSSPGMGVDRLRQMAEAERNSGKGDGKFLDVMAQAAEVDPKSVANTASILLASHPAGQKALQAYLDWQKGGREGVLAGLEGQKIEAQTGQARAAAEASRASAQSSLSQAMVNMSREGREKELHQYELAAKRGAEISRSLEEQIKKQKILQNERDLAKTERETENIDKRITLNQQKIDENNKAIDQNVRKSNKELSLLIKDIDDTLKFMDENPWNVSFSTGPLAGSSTGQAMTFFQDSADFQEKINALKAKKFMATMESFRGLGALSNMEGEKGASALGNLSLRQSPAQVAQTLRDIKATAEADLNFLVKRSGKPLESFRGGTKPGEKSKPATSPNEMIEILGKYGVK